MSKTSNAASKRPQLLLSYVQHWRRCYGLAPGCAVHAHAKQSLSPNLCTCFLPCRGLSGPGQCRNPLRMMPQPFCFVASWPYLELCRVPVCSADAIAASSSQAAGPKPAPRGSSLSAPARSAIIALTLVLAAALAALALAVLLFCRQRSRARRAKAASRAPPPEQAARRQSASPKSSHSSAQASAAEEPLRPSNSSASSTVQSAPGTRAPAASRFAVHAPSSGRRAASRRQRVPRHWPRRGAPARNGTDTRMWVTNPIARPALLEGASLHVSLDTSLRAPAAPAQPVVPASSQELVELVEYPTADAPADAAALAAPAGALGAGAGAHLGEPPNLPARRASSAGQAPAGGPEVEPDAGAYVPPAAAASMQPPHAQRVQQMFAPVAPHRQPRPVYLEPTRPGAPWQHAARDAYGSSNGSGASAALRHMDTHGTSTASTAAHGSCAMTTRNDLRLIECSTSANDCSAPDIAEMQPAAPGGLPPAAAPPALPAAAARLQAAQLLSVQQWERRLPQSRSFEQQLQHRAGARRARRAAEPCRPSSWQQPSPEREADQSYPSADNASTSSGAPGRAHAFRPVIAACCLMLLCSALPSKIPLGALHCESAAHER